MTTSKNDITGDDIKSKAASAAYRDNYDLIFRKRNVAISKRGEEFEYDAASPVVHLSQQQQAAVDDTAGLEK
jgi:hypothetical protein